MRKILLLFTPILLHAGICGAQGFEWAKNLGGGLTDDVYGLSTDAVGNVYAAGSFMVTADFDPGSASHYVTSEGASDAYVVKLTANGAFQWAKAFGGSLNDYGRKVRTDASGNVYLMGMFTGSVDFSGAGGANSLLSNGNGTLQDLFVVKLDASGNFVWAIQRQSPNGESFVNDCDLKLDASGDLYMCYGFGSGYSGNHIIIEKANSSNGGTTWTKTINTTAGSSLLAYANLALDASGNIFVAGEFGGDVDFDPDATANIVTAASTPTAYVLKLTNAGGFGWVSPVGNIAGTLTRAFDVTTDGIGNVIVTGRFGGMVDFDPGTGVHIADAGTGIDAYVLKLSGAGSFAWMQSWGLSYSSTSGVAADAAGAVYVTGYFVDSCTFGVPPNAVTLNNNINFSSEGYTVKFNGNGDFQWVKQMGGGVTNTTSCNSIAVSNMGAVYTGGIFNNMANFDANSSPGYTLFSNGSDDGFIQKVFGCAAIDAGVTQSGSTLTANANGTTYQWINCSNNTPVSGATSKTFTPTVSGNYAVILTQNGCGSTSVCNTVIGTGVAEVQTAVVAIYPNPTNGDVSIELRKEYSNVEVVITSAIGAVVSRTEYSDTQLINTAVEGATGVYFISIVADGVVIARERVVKAD